MALAFSKIEAVKFGDFEVTPQMDKELKLRVQNLEVRQDDFDEAIELLSKCFGSDNTERVRDFMKKHMFYLDIMRLRTYLSQGEAGLASLDERMEKMVDKEMEKAIATARAERTAGVHE